jgi:hypothetical protein
MARIQRTLQNEFNQVHITGSEEDVRTIEAVDLKLGKLAADFSKVAPPDAADALVQMLATCQEMDKALAWVTATSPKTGREVDFLVYGGTMKGANGAAGTPWKFTRQVGAAHKFN